MRPIGSIWQKCRALRRLPNQCATLQSASITSGMACFLLLKKIFLIIYPVTGKPSDRHNASALSKHKLDKYLLQRPASRLDCYLQHTFQTFAKDAIAFRDFIKGEAVRQQRSQIYPLVSDNLH